MNNDHYFEMKNFVLNYIMKPDSSEIDRERWIERYFDCLDRMLLIKNHLTQEQYDELAALVSDI